MGKVWRRNDKARLRSLKDLTPEGWERAPTKVVFYCKKCDALASEHSVGDKCRNLVNPCGGTFHKVLREKCSSDPKPIYERRRLVDLYNDINMRPNAPGRRLVER